jgi:hypothetical protein
MEEIKLWKVDGFKESLIIADVSSVGQTKTEEMLERDGIANYCFPKTWPADREQRARIIGEWLRTQARYLA